MKNEATAHTLDAAGMLHRADGTFATRNEREVWEASIFGADWQAAGFASGALFASALDFYFVTVAQACMQRLQAATVVQAAYAPKVYPKRVSKAQQHHAFNVVAFNRSLD